MGGRVPIRLYQELVASAYLSFVIPSLMVFEFGGGWDDAAQEALGLRILKVK
jgi:hypothetical protein